MSQEWRCGSLGKRSDKKVFIYFECEEDDCGWSGKRHFSQKNCPDCRHPLPKTSRPLRPKEGLNPEGGEVGKDTVYPCFHPTCPNTSARKCNGCEKRWCATHFGRASDTICWYCKDPMRRWPVFTADLLRHLLKKKGPE